MLIFSELIRFPVFLRVKIQKIVKYLQQKSLLYLIFYWKLFKLK